jgi:hypothetical protein
VHEEPALGVESRPVLSMGGEDEDSEEQNGPEAACEWQFYKSM